MPACRLDILGGFSLRDGEGRPLPLTTRKDKFVLASLALSAGKALPREKLCNLLWADRGEEQSRGSLRQSLAAIRDAFRTAGVEPVQAGRDSVTLDAADLEIDALSFEAAAGNPARQAEALGLFRGPLLAGLDAPATEAGIWLAGERQRLDGVAVDLVQRISLDPQAKALVAAAITLAQRLRSQDELNEMLCRALMRLLWRSGDKAAALKTYKNCSDVLSRDLGIPPGLETEQLYRDIVTDHSSAIAKPYNSDARPSLAVMPFDNISADSALAPFCEGLAEEVITGLGRFRFLDIIDRNSSAAIARQTSDVAEIGVKLGVMMVLQGSLQRSGERMRITVRLVQAQSRKQLWSDVLEFAAEDLPSMPQKIAQAIVMGLHPRVEQTLLELSQRKPSLAAYECVLRGIRHIRGYAPDDNGLAVACFDNALALDPDYAVAKAYRGFSDIVLHNYEATPPGVMKQSLALLNEAVQIDPNDARCRWLLAMALGFSGDLAGEMREYGKALSLNPYDANVLASYGVSLAAMGQSELGIGHIREAMRLNPYHPDWYWLDLASALFVARRYREAAEAYSRKANPLIFVRSRLAACYAKAGMMEEAKREAAEILRLKPEFRISQQRTGTWMNNDIEHFREGMRMAGLPE